MDQIIGAVCHERNQLMVDVEQMHREIHDLKVRCGELLVAAKLADGLIDNRIGNCGIGQRLKHAIASMEQF